MYFLLGRQRLQLAKHQSATALPDIIGDHNPACVMFGIGVLVPVLEILQVLPVPLPETRSTRLYVDIIHVACAIYKAGNGVEQRGAYDVADLKAGMIVTVPKGRQLSDLLVAQGREAEFLRENGVRDVDILGLIPTVCDADAVIISAR